MSFIKKEIEIIYDMKEFNYILNYCKELKTKVNSEEEAKMLDIPAYSCYIVHKGKTKLSLYCKYFNNKYKEYDFYLDGKEATLTKSAMQCFSLIQRMSHKGVVDLTNSEFYEGTDKNGRALWNCGYNTGIIYKNKKYFNQRIDNVYSYDVNSMFGWGLMQDMPDTSVPPKRNCVPNENEIGMSNVSYEYDDGVYLYVIENATDYNIECEYVFPRIESPFKKPIMYYYNLKKNAKTKEERQKYKEILNYSIGYIRRKNPFIHSAAIGYTRRKIASLVDKNTIYGVSDSIISTKPRPDLEIGEEIGEFKIEREKQQFAINDSGYQWNYEIPSIRGISKQWFVNGFDILKDEIPGVECNKYIYDNVNQQIILNDNYVED